jgi:hypothetical protein
MQKMTRAPADRGVGVTVHARRRLPIGSVADELDREAG